MSNKFKSGQLVLVEMSSPRHYNNKDWKADIINGEDSCRFNELKALSGSGSENFGDSGRIYALAKISSVDSGDGVYVNFIDGEGSCFAPQESVHFVNELNNIAPAATKEGLDKSIVIASPKVISHLEKLGFENVQEVDLNAKALWIQDNMFVELNSAHDGSTAVKFITPQDVFAVKLPPVKVTIELEVSRDDYDEIVEDDELTSELEDKVVEAIQSAEA